MKIFRTYLQVMTYIPEYICNQVLTFFILSFIKVSIVACSSSGSKYNSITG